ncbi:MAG TPA: hypothetical protein VGF12_12405, partial [Roseateles sp.]
MPTLPRKPDSRPARRAAGRRTTSGDTPPQLDAASLEQHRVSRATTRQQVVGSETLAELLRRHRQQESSHEALADELATLLDGSSPDERRHLRRALRQHEQAVAPPDAADADGELSPGWRQGGY